MSRPVGSWAVRLLVIATASVTLLSSSTAARRLPAPGGRATVALPADLSQALTEAHVFAPLLEAIPEGSTDDGSSLRGALPDWPGYRSSVLRTLSSSPDKKVWRFQTLAPKDMVQEAAAGCFQGDAWPAEVLRAAGHKVEVSAQGDDVILRFSGPVGPVPELLAGCSLKAAGSVATGPYVLVAPGVLAWRSGSIDDAPLLGVLELRGPNERADVAAGERDVPGTSTLLAPFPDMVLLLQAAPTRDQDPLGLTDASMGQSGFQEALRADLLAAAYGAGRGAAAIGLLPPGVAPARPLPAPQGTDRNPPLSLLQLPSSAPRVPLRVAEGDALLAGVVERLAVLLRNRGFALDTRPKSREPLLEGYEVLRWRPPSLDPALAVLALAGKRPELVDENVARALADARLLSPSREERVEAALAVERAWLESNLVVPLLTADRWFAVDPDLRGVVIRADGVPLLDDAWWGGGGGALVGGGAP